MAFNESLAERIRQQLARRKNIQEKRMFGGIAFLQNGNMLVGVTKDSLLVRLGNEDGGEAVKEPHVSTFNMTGRTMTGWVVVAPDGVQADAQLQGWIERATKFVRTLPAK
jgi:TfoX/Sxy family transcriptional regulator of competence genes